MKLLSKKLFQISFCMILIGIILTGIGLIAGGRPGVTFSGEGITSPYNDADKEPYTLEKTKLSAFSDIKIQISSCADIQILPSQDTDFYLEYKLDGAYAKPVCEVKNNTFFLTQKESTLGRIYIFNVSFGKESASDSFVTLYVPEKQKIQNLNLYNDMGNVLLSELKIHTAKITAEYGNVDLQDLTAEELTLRLESGNLDTRSLETNRFLLQCDYGNAVLHDFQAKDADLRLESGSLTAISGEFGNLNASSSYGSFDLRDFSAKTADLTLESGDLRLDVKELTRLACKNEYGNTEICLLEDPFSYSINAHTDYGRIYLPENILQGHHISSDAEEDYQTKGASDKNITVQAESGDITIIAGTE